MRHISVTPFGRQPVTAGLLATHALAEGLAPVVSPDKWALLRDLTTARLAFGVSDRDLAVLSALMSFHPAKELLDDDRLIVFPSNAALSDRAHGMAESTLRRHLAALIRAGLILRRDSPNGKRYATRSGAGALDRVFGFDLRPLLVQSPKIAALAADTREATLALRRLREMTVIRLRDSAKLLAWGHEQEPGRWDDQLAAVALRQRQLRRKLDYEAMKALAADVEGLSAAITKAFKDNTKEMSGNDGQNERHYQNSNNKNLESELCKEKQKAGVEVAPSLPLPVVLKAAPDIKDYAQTPIRDWGDLLATCTFLRPMLGISVDAWQRACDVMGPVTAAIVLACLLQRSKEISRPGGYLRSLTDKAERDGFSPGPMVMALIRSENARAS